MARSNRNNQSEAKAPRRSARTHNEPDRFVIPVDPPKTKKSSSTKGRARKEAAVKTAAATKTRKEKPKKAATARKTAPKKVKEPKPKASRKRAREVEPNQDDEPRPKRARPVANIPRRRVATRARPVPPSPPPPPSPSPSPILPLSPSPSPDPVIKEEEMDDEVDELEEDRASTAPTEVEPEVVGTGTIPDIQANLPPLFGPPLLTPPLPNPFAPPSLPAATAAPTVAPQSPPNPQVATPPAQHGPLPPPINDATPTHVQNPVLGINFLVNDPDEQPPPTPLRRSYAVVYPRNQQ